MDATQIEKTMNKRLLLLSNSTNLGESFLSYSRQEIKTFLGESVKTILFIPFAGVRSTYDEYTQRVEKAFNDIGYDVMPLHRSKNLQESIQAAEAIVVGGGNTFHLLYQLQETKVIETLRETVRKGIPYIGWSAGSNIACPTIKTTNDMPIIETRSFEGLNLIPFQINPHYTDGVIPNHNGETREARIQEFIAINHDTYVVGLKEGTLLKLENSSLRLIGNQTMRLFKFGEPIRDYGSDANLDFLVK